MDVFILHRKEILAQIFSGGDGDKQMIQSDNGE